MCFPSVSIISHDLMTKCLDNPNFLPRRSAILARKMVTSLSSSIHLCNTCERRVLICSAVRPGREPIGSGAMPENSDKRYKRFSQTSSLLNILEQEEHFGPSLQMQSELLASIQYHLLDLLSDFEREEPICSDLQHQQLKRAHMKNRQLPTRPLFLHDPSAGTWKV